MPYDPMKDKASVKLKKPKTPNEQGAVGREAGKRTSPVSQSMSVSAPPSPRPSPAPNTMAAPVSYAPRPSPPMQDNSGFGSISSAINQSSFASPMDILSPPPNAAPPRPLAFASGGGLQGPGLASAAQPLAGNATRGLNPSGGQGFAQVLQALQALQAQRPQGNMAFQSGGGLRAPASNPGLQFQGGGPLNGPQQGQGQPDIRSLLQALMARRGQGQPGMSTGPVDPWTMMAAQGGFR